MAIIQTCRVSIEGNRIRFVPVQGPTWEVPLGALTDAVMKLYLLTHDYMFVRIRRDEQSATFLNLVDHDEWEARRAARLAHKTNAPAVTRAERKPCSKQS